MIGRIHLVHCAGIGSKALTRSGVILLSTFAASGAYAQCNLVGMNPPITFPGPTAVTAVAGASAYVGTIAASIHSANTAFLSQSSAFVASPPNPAPDQPGGGIWARGVGGHTTFETTATAGNIKFDGPIAGNVVCNTRTVVDFAGVQIGTDIARLNVGGWNVHTGSTIGYLGSKSKDGTPGLTPAASFQDTLQIPFAGLYFAASKGGLLIDGQVRWTFFQNDVSDANHGMSGQPFDARSVSVNGNIGYNYNLGNQWFVEPSAGIVWSRTQVDTMNVPGTMVYGPGGIVPPWTLAVRDIDSTLGRLSVRAGTSVAYNNVVLQPFASASVFREFQGRVISSLVSDFGAIGVNAPTLSSTVSVSSVGTYGQFGLGLAAQALDGSWASFLRADYRKGDNIEGWGLNGGFRYQFVPERTVIAKAPVYKSPVRETGYDWSGFYAGAQLGATWGPARWTLDGYGTVEPRLAGLLGGGEIGFNHQVGRWVFGLQGDMNWSNAHGARPCPNGFFYSCESELDFLATTTARIGYAYWDRLLVYAKGGLAIARERDRYSCNTGSQTTHGVLLVGCPSQTDTNTKTGWTVGWGTEFGLTRTISLKSETSYVDLGTDHFNVAGVPTEIQRSGFTSTIGLHVRLGQ
jgi:opacity protein-like surface antigen